MKKDLTPEQTKAVLSQFKSLGGSIRINRPKSDPNALKITLKLPGVGKAIVDLEFEESVAHFSAQDLEDFKNCKGAARTAMALIEAQSFTQEAPNG